LALTQTASVHQILPADTLLAGRFRILAFEGAGSFGQVYKARDVTLNTLVAIKLLHSHIAEDLPALKAFQNEILILRQLSHHNILRVYEYYQDDNRHFITADWVHGVTLEGKINAKSLSDTQIASYLKQLADAVEFAASHGIIHRDLKPENILIDGHDRLIITDYGLAMMLEKHEPGVHGSPLYCPPEYLSRGEVHETTDLYAIGVIAYQMCCASLPFTATRLDALRTEKYHPNHTFPVLKKEWRKYKDLVFTLISPDPAGRLQTAEELRIRLQTLGRGHPPGRRLLWPACLLLITCLLAYGYLEDHIRMPVKPNPASLAILPLERDAANPDASWMSYSVPEFIFRSLKSNPDIRLLDNARVEKTLALLGFKPQLTESQLRVLAEVLNVNYLLQTRVLQLGAEQQELSSQLINISGEQLSQQLLQKSLIKDNISGEIDTIATAILARLHGKFAVSPQAKLSPETLAAQAQVQDLLQAGDKQGAKQALVTLLTHDDQYAQGWLQLGELHLQDGEHQAARRAFKRIQALPGSEQVTQQLAQAYLQRIAGDSNAELSLYESLVQQYPYRTDLRFRLASLYTDKEAFSQAAVLLKQLLRQDPQHPSAWLELAKIAIYSGDVERAIDEYLVRALIIANKLKDTQTKGDVLNAFGVAYQRLGEIDKAIENYNAGLQIRNQLQDTLGAATSMSNLAALLAIRGEYRQAFQYLEASLETYSQAGDQAGTANIYNELGVLSEEQGHYHAALDYYRKSLNIRMRLGDDWPKAESLNNIGYLYFLLSDNEHARVYWQQAEMYYKQLADPVGQLRISQNYGQLALQQGDWKLAYRHLEASLEQARQLALNEETLVAQAYLAKLAFLQGGLATAMQANTRLLAALAERQDIRGIMEFSLWSADWHILLGNFPAARAALDSIAPQLERQGNPEQTLLFAILNDRLTDQDFARFTAQPDIQNVTAIGNDEIPVPIRLKQLLYLTADSLWRGTGDADALIAAINSHDIQAYPYEHIWLIELQAMQALRRGDWMALGRYISQGQFLMKKLGNYWRRFQFERLQAMLLKQRHQPYQPMLERANTQLAQLQAQLPAPLRPHFLAMQNRLFDPLPDELIPPKESVTHE
jgi:eukaryotic-like serine/threonine-protein kinase